MMKPVLSCEDDPPVDDSDRSMLLEVFFTGRVGSPASSSGPIAAATAGAAEHAPPLAPAPPPSPPNAEDQAAEPSVQYAMSLLWPNAEVLVLLLFAP